MDWRCFHIETPSPRLRVEATYPSPPRDCVAIASKGEEAVRFQSFRMRVF